MHPEIEARRAALLARVRDALLSVERVALTTHVNADGDGAGSQAALSAWLDGQGKRVCIVNPTPFPRMFLHLLPDPAWVVDAAAPDSADVIAQTQLLCVLDTGEPKRIGRVAQLFASRPHVVLDHHLPSDAGFTGLVLQDDSACATGELVYDLLSLAQLPRPWSPSIREGLYTALLTDTGSFRYSNTTPRTHAMAADLLAQGVDPEAVYRRIYATVPRARVELLRHALDRLEVDPELPITWMSIERGVMERLGTTTDDLEGILEHARSLEGTEVALLFREMADGSTKVSFRSTGAANVNAIARQFGGGGHAKASGALIGERLAGARQRVLEATRAALRNGEAGFRAAVGDR
jgi:phosphoesterase RecJ-like protein